ncbi:hypothetical protein RJ640_022173 [Escallonia rubra]|uniref:Scarecrow-like protein 30 n=1 Tax=Escallonia rubra TaxID=112253 RepID=A0AA88SB69_9ASTE|nr:hypothetical protein RJ640_022173 [Escallonia rubra]
MGYISNQNHANGYQNHRDNCHTRLPILQNDPNSQSLPHPLETCHSMALNSEGGANDCYSYLLLLQNGLNSESQLQSHHGDPSPSINSEGVANECCSSTHLPILQNGSRSDSLDTDHSLGVNSDGDANNYRSCTHLQILHSGSDSQPHPLNTDHSSGLNSDEDDNATVELDYFDGVLKFINEMLMEDDDLINKPCMFHDCSALQAAEKAFYDALGQESPDENFTGACSSDSSNSPSVDNFVESNQIYNQSSLVDSTIRTNLQPYISFCNYCNVTHSLGDSGDQVELNQSLPNVQPNLATSEVTEPTKNGRDLCSSGLARTKNSREDTDSSQEGRSNKQLASFIEEPEQSEMYDKALLCPRMNPGLHKDKLQQNEQPKRSNAGRQRGERRDSTKEIVDLRNLLTQCAQAVASSNIKTADELLKQIRQHSSPTGDGIERMAHYFADAIEARLAGTGTALYAAITTRRIMAADILKAYQVYVTACPFKRMSNIFADKSIAKLAMDATTLHIIDFGILYGFQWPCLMQGLSLRPGGPPKLRITGIDLPQPGFRPAERVEETGRRLANYCKRFNVPFEYKAIAKKWDSIQIEELEINKDETLVVNCVYRLANVPDETFAVNCPRGTVLNLIKKINPDMFVQGVLNGTYNGPFFVTRFREAMFHFSALFDMFEAVVPREDPERRLFEQEVFARDAMNVIACEGIARIERPETYKQWQIRTLRAGFRQLPPHKDIVKEIITKVKLHYHKDFLVYEDSNWLLQGWKGRVIYALSCWKPVQE